MVEETADGLNINKIFSLENKDELVKRGLSSMTDYEEQKERTGYAEQTIEKTEKKMRSDRNFATKDISPRRMAT